MMAIFRILLMLLVGVWPTDGQAEFQMNDFAYGFRITTPQQKAIVRLALPETVYRHLVRSDAGDIRVFSMDGLVVPHYLRHPSMGATPSQKRDLPFYPWPKADVGTGMLTAPIRTDSEGAVMPPGPLPKDSGDQPPSVYLIDISHVDQSLEELILTWRRHRPDVVVRARLEASQDRSNWVRLAESIPLADIRHGAHRVQTRTILLPANRIPARYLRLTWLEGEGAISIEQLEGVLMPGSSDRERKWIQAVHRSDMEVRGTMQFDSGGVFPVDRIDLELNQVGSLLTGTIKSRASEQSVWQIHYKGSFFHLSMNNMALHNDPVRLSATTDRYWQLDIDKRQSNFGASVPQLMLGGRPHELFFMSEPNQAYLLAFGSRKVKGLTDDSTLKKRVEAGGNRIMLAGIGPRITLGGTSRLVGSSGRAPGRMVSLSTMLLGCVLFVALLAWWAVRRMLR